MFRLDVPYCGVSVVDWFGPRPRPLRQRRGLASTVAAVAIELDGVLGDTRPLYDAWLADVSRRAHVDPGAARRGAAELAGAARAVRRGSRARLPAPERAGDRGAAPAAGRRRRGSASSPTRPRSWRGSRSPTSARPAGSRRSRPGPARSSGCSARSGRRRAMVRSLADLPT